MLERQVKRVVSMRTITKIVDMVESPDYNPASNEGRGEWSLRDVSHQEVFLDDKWDKPTCVVHGAMNAVSPDRSLWRCLACGRSCYAFWS